jgi:peptidoglycan/LPS O-acetylase OafA/YrhL
LDGIRAVAVTLVIVSHCFVGARGAGPVGVGVFFVLSGFLITSILATERATTGTVDLRFFYIRRALRLYPALVAFVAVFVAGLVLGVWPTALAKGLGTAAMALSYTTDVFTIVGKGRWVAPELRLTWSLAVEEQFYLLWPITYLVLARKLKTTHRLIAALAVGTVVAALARWAASTQAAVALSPITWTDALLIGGAIAVACRSGMLQPRRINILVMAVAALPALRIARYGYRPGFDQIIGLTLFDLGVGLWILHALAPPGRFDVLGSRALARLGRLSYGMYLWHSIVIALLAPHYAEGSIFFLVVVYAVTVGVAEISYRYVELPFLRRKLRFTRANLGAA